MHLGASMGRPNNNQEDEMPQMKSHLQSQK